MLRGVKSVVSRTPTLLISTFKTGRSTHVLVLMKIRRLTFSVWLIVVSVPPLSSRARLHLDSSVEASSNPKFVFLAKEFHHSEKV